MAPGGGSLVVNEAEAARVREVFEVYLAEGSLGATARDLNRRGWTLKAWTTREGRPHEGGAWTKENLRRFLSNVLYTGRVNHKGTVYPGEHPAIVEEKVWRRAQALLRRNARGGARETRNRHGALLRGLLRCVPCDASMVHAYTRKRGSKGDGRGDKLYRYYVCLRAQKEGWASCPTKALPVGEVERFVVEHIRAIGKDPEMVAETLEAARAQHAEAVKRVEADRRTAERDLRELESEVRRVVGENGNGEATARLADLQDRLREAERRMTEVRERAVALDREAVDEADLAKALALFDSTWDALFPKEQARVLRLLVEGVGYDGATGTMAVTFRPTGIRALAGEVESARETGRGEAGR